MALVLKYYPWSKGKHRILKLTLLFPVGMAFFVIVVGYFFHVIFYLGVCLVGWVILSFKTRSVFAAQAGFNLTFLVSFKLSTRHSRELSERVSIGQIGTPVMRFLNC